MVIKICILLFFLVTRYDVIFSEMLWKPIPLRTEVQKQKGYVGGEMGQMGFTIAISPQDPNYMALGINTAPIYISTDGGKSWNIRCKGIYSNGVISIAFDPKNKQILWASGFKGIYGTKVDNSDTKADGIYRSTDTGQNWTLIKNVGFTGHQLAQNEYFAFDIKSYDGKQCKTIYAVTHNIGLLKTIDAGATWQTLGFTNELINAVVLHPKNNNLLFVGSEKGLFRSDDSGNTFKKIGENLPKGISIMGLVVHPWDEKIIYIATKGGVWISKNGGQSFESCSSGLPKNNNWVRLSISPVDPNRLYVDADLVAGMYPYWTENGGLNWYPPNSIEDGFYQGSSKYWCEGLVAHPIDPLVAFHLHPVRKTTDGGKTWRYSSDGISGFRRGYRTSIAFRPENPLKMVFFHIDHGSTLTENGGDTFKYLPPPRQTDIGAITTTVGAYNPTSMSKFVVSAVGGWEIQRLCYSEDDCLTWTVIPNTEGYYVFMAYHQQNPNIVYAGKGNGDSCRSNDGGKTWSVISGKSIRAMVLKNSKIVFAINSLKNAVFRSDDCGNTWTSLPTVPGPQEIFDLDCDPQDGSRLYAATMDSVWVYCEGKWKRKSSSDGLDKDYFGDRVFWTIAVDTTNPNIIYSGQWHVWRGVAKGIFRSTDYGEHWENITYNLGPDLTVWAITISPHDGTVYLGTDFGNWKLSIPYKSK